MSIKKSLLLLPFLLSGCTNTINSNGYYTYSSIFESSNEDSSQEYWSPFLFCGNSYFNTPDFIKYLNSDMKKRLNKVISLTPLQNPHGEKFITKVSAPLICRTTLHFEDKTTQTGYLTLNIARPKPSLIADTPLIRFLTLFVFDATKDPGRYLSFDWITDKEVEMRKVLSIQDTISYDLRTTYQCYYDRLRSKGGHTWTETEIVYVKDPAKCHSGKYEIYADPNKPTTTLKQVDSICELEKKYPTPPPEKGVERLIYGKQC